MEHSHIVEKVFPTGVRLSYIFSALAPTSLHNMFFKHSAHGFAVLRQLLYVAMGKVCKCTWHGSRPINCQKLLSLHFSSTHTHGDGHLIDLNGSPFCSLLSITKFCVDLSCGLLTPVRNTLRYGNIPSSWRKWTACICKWLSNDRTGMTYIRFLWRNEIKTRPIHTQSYSAINQCGLNACKLENLVDIKLNIYWMHWIFISFHFYSRVLCLTLNVYLWYEFKFHRTKYTTQTHTISTISE